MIKLYTIALFNTEIVVIRDSTPLMTKTLEGEALAVLKNKRFSPSKVLLPKHQT